MSGPGYQGRPCERTTVEIQQDPLQPVSILQAAARAGARRAGERLTGQAYEGHYLDTEIYLLPFLTYTCPGSPGIADLPLKMLTQDARTQAIGTSRSHVPVAQHSGEEPRLLRRPEPPSTT